MTLVAARLRRGASAGLVAPINTVAPALSGTAVVGQTMSCSTGTWTGSAPITYSYQWLRNGAVIPGQTGSTYLLDPANDIGVTISCVVTATNAQGSASASSNTVTPTAPPLTYTLRDQFTTAQAAPLTTPRTAEPGPGTLQMVDVAGGADASISGGKYLRPKPTSAQAYTNYGAWSSAGLARSCGLACYSIAQFANATGITPASFSATAALGQGVADLLVNTAAIQIIDKSGTINVAPAVALNTDYQFAVVLRGNGALYLIRGGAYTAWTLLYVGAASTDPVLYPMTADFNGGVTMDEFAVAQLAGPLAREFGKCVDINPIPENGVTRVGVADGHSYFTWTPLAAEILSLYFRRTDDDNTYRLDCDQAAGTIKLYRRVAGVDTELAAGQTQTWTAGTHYRIGIVYAGGEIRTFVAGANLATAAKHVVTGESFNLTTAGGKASGFSAGANWECWPRTFAGTDLATLA